MSKLPLSVAMITRDSAGKLRGCLESVSFADEIVIVDSGSTDETEAIAREFNARWFVEPWKGYGPQRNSVLEKCSHDWVLIVDHDERVPAECARQIARIVSGKNRANAYAVRRKNHLHGKWIKVGDLWPDYGTRLMKRSKGRYERVVHENWATEGAVVRLDCAIEHFSHDSYAEMFSMVNRYSTIAAEQMHAEGKSAGPADAVLRSAWMFFRNYVLRLGFTAGFDGFMIACAKAMGSFLKYSKLYEMRKYR